VYDAEVRKSPAQDHLVVVHHLLVHGNARHDDRNAADLPGIHHTARSALEHDRVGLAVLAEEHLVWKHLMILRVPHRTGGAMLEHDRRPVSRGPWLEPLDEAVEGVVIRPDAGDDGERVAHRTRPTGFERGMRSPSWSHWVRYWSTTG
jgi:hypothetical protein